MEAGNTLTADPVDTVHHEMDITVHSHRFFLIRVVASNRRTTRPREGAAGPQ